MRYRALVVSVVCAAWIAPWTSVGAQESSADVAKAIQGQFDVLLAAFTEGNPQRAAEVFLPDGEWTNEEGIVFKGREAIAELFAAFFERFPQRKLEFDVQSVRSLTSKLALVEVIRKVVAGEGASESLTRSTVTFAEDGGHWLMASVIDDAAEDELTPHEHLQPLAWLVGEWVDEAADSVIEIKADWSEDQNFLLIHYRVVRNGEVAMNSQQRIGWDPLAQKVRSWLFDSDGGFGEGVWTRAAGQWVVKSTAVMPDGTTGSATFIFVPDGKDRFTMHALDRIVGDEVIEDTTVTIVRKPPPAK